MRQDRHERLVWVPPLVRIQPMMNASFPDHCSKHLIILGPPDTHCLITDIDAMLE